MFACCWTDKTLIVSQIKMNKEQPIAKNQHYVPRLVLKRFSMPVKKGKDPQVFVYEKSSGRIFPSNVKNIASERDFYNGEIEGINFTFELSLSEIESRVGGILNTVLKNKSVNQLSDSERIDLSKFFCLQMIRTRQHRAMLTDATQKLEDLLKANGHDCSLLDEESIKLSTFKQLMTHAQHYERFYEKDWVLLEAPEGKSFITSDHPVVLRNSSGGQLGLKCEGIEAYFPLSSKFCLAMLCSSYKQSLLKQNEEYVRWLEIAKYLGVSNEDDSGTYGPLDSLINAFQNGSVVKIDSSHLLGLNEMQVVFSEHQLYSSNKDFTFADNMIEKNSSYKHGLRMTVG